MTNILSSMDYLDDAAFSYERGRVDAQVLIDALAELRSALDENDADAMTVKVAERKLAEHGGLL